MSRETAYTIYCLERYRFYKGLSGAEAAELFREHDLYEYIRKYFEVLHTMGDRYLVQDIDAYIGEARQQAAGA